MVLEGWQRSLEKDYAEWLAEKEFLRKVLEY